jgi:hypothetical protein
MASQLAQLRRVEMFCESEGDCTSETGVGQFSIFGAVEENGGPRRLRNVGREVMGERSMVAALDGSVFARGSWR